MDDNVTATTLRIQFQDSNGNIIHWHTDARVVFFPDGTSLYALYNNEVTDEQINQILAD